LIKEKDVVTMRVPFPDIDSNLAVSPHMYICMKNSSEKKFIKCQSKKPHHLMKNKEPFRRVVEDPNISRNPFKRKTLIDCDKVFVINGVTIHSELLTTSRKDICEDLFQQVKRAATHEKLGTHQMEKKLLLKLNRKIKSVSE